MIYFIAADALGAVKIGYTNDAMKRLRLLQTGCPCQLTILAIIEGDERSERNLHLRFASLRTRGEWFELAGDLRDFVEALPKYERPKRGPTIADLAAASGMSRSYVAMIRSGARANIKAALHLFRTTGWKHPMLAEVGDAQARELADKIPWKKAA